MKLPLLEARAAETRLCTYCPKLCRPACPVSTVEGRETVTPWGKMRAMGELSRGAAPMDRAHAAPAYACTGCMACFELCDLDNPVADTLRDGRAEALQAHTAPEGVERFVREFPVRERALAERARAMPAGGGRVALFPGCTAATFDAEDLPKLAAAVEVLDSPCGVVSDACCGLPLLEAGDRDGFAARARNLAARLAGFDRVITPDAGCAHALKTAYPRLGVALPLVQHFAQAAAASLGRLTPLRDPPADVAYHDSCRLGRGLGVYDEPRAVLTRLLGRAPIELPGSRERAPCSGAGGLLPVSRPETAAGIARDLASLAKEVGARTVVTACASSRRQLERAGVRAVDLATLVARAVAEARPGGDGAT